VVALLPASNETRAPWSRAPPAFDGFTFSRMTRSEAAGSVLIRQQQAEERPGEPEERPAEKSEFGTQEPEVLFYGETLEKIGERKYKITKGGFTTCVQPKPRWQFTSGTAILNIDHYAMLVNSLMRVKGVPILYLPVIYYPINKEDRSTGFLLPVYGTSTLKGHTLSNAFFWAISRSQDATFTHDWYSKTGQGFSTEYRYVRSRASSGEARVYVLRERPTSYVGTSGDTVSVAGSRSFDARGSLAQELPWKLRGRARVDYFSDITVQQTYNTNVYDASRRQRSYSGSVSGTYGAYSVSGSADRSEYFFSTTSSTVSGTLPRLTVSRGEQPIKGLPVYFGASGEYAGLLRKTNAGGTVTDTGLKRIDVSPAIRVPFRKFPFFTVNSSLGLRYTRWAESLDATTLQQVPASLDRTYVDMQVRVVGPVFNRIFNTPGSGYAEKLKHTIEPWVNIQRVTNFDEAARIVQLDSTDYVVGGTTRIQFGLNSRLYAKRKGGADAGRSREILNVSARQTYYTKAAASTVDTNYSSSYLGTEAHKMSAVSLAARVSPTDTLNGTFRGEFNTYKNAFLTLSASGSYAFRDNVAVSAGWSKRRFIPDLAGYNFEASATHYLNADATFRFSQNRYGGSLSINYDLKNDYFLQRRIAVYYNAQCCGITASYQTYNFGGLVSSAVTQDRRFSISISLAGIGSFAPPFGGMGPR
jgi:LPS-assembly protein